MYKVENEHDTGLAGLASKAIVTDRKERKEGANDEVYRLMMERVLEAKHLAAGASRKSGKSLHQKGGGEAKLSMSRGASQAKLGAVAAAAEPLERLEQEGGSLSRLPSSGNVVSFDDDGGVGDYQELERMNESKPLIRS